MLLRTFKSLARAGVIGIAAAAIVGGTSARAETDTVRLDFAYYNPVGLVLKDKGLLEEAFKDDGIAIEWVQSHGSNKALEFLNVGSLDFGSSAGAAALLARINGVPVNSIHV